jgi:uncharacterized membrane protein YgcG
MPTRKNGRTQSPQSSRRSFFSARAASSAFIVLIVAAAVWFFWSRGAAPLASGACRGCNVLLITIDTCVHNVLAAAPKANRPGSSDMGILR